MGKFASIRGEKLIALDCTLIKRLVDLCRRYFSAYDVKDKSQRKGDSFEMMLQSQKLDPCLMDIEHFKINSRKRKVGESMCTLSLS